MNSSFPVTDLLVTKSCAWSESLYAVILTKGPRYSNLFYEDEIISSASG